MLILLLAVCKIRTASTPIIHKKQYWFSTKTWDNLIQVHYAVFMCRLSRDTDEGAKFSTVDGTESDECIYALIGIN